MKNIFAALACLMLASPVAASPPVDLGPPPVTDPTFPIVRVDCATGFGSATHVGGGKYISVNHVTSLIGCKVNGVPIHVTYADKKKDFSTFTGPVLPSAVKISCDGFKRKDIYVMRGYAFASSAPWFQPVIAAVEYEGFMTFVGDDFPGMSGGPVLDTKGRITGTVNIGNPTGGVDLKYTPICRK